MRIEPMDWLSKTHRGYISVFLPIDYILRVTNITIEILYIAFKKFIWYCR